MMDVQADHFAHLGAIWCTSFNCSQLPTHTLITYRDQLDFMPSDQRVMRQFARAQHIPDACDTRLDLHRIQLRGNNHTYLGTQHASHVEAWYQWRLCVRDGPALAYMRWYRRITRVYIRNPANRDTRSVRYQLAGVDRRIMIHFTNKFFFLFKYSHAFHLFMFTSNVVIQEPPSYPSQMAIFAKKVQTIIRRCMVSIGGTLGCTLSQHDIQQTFLVQPSRSHPREHVPDRGTRGVNRGARRQPGCGAGGGRPPVPPFLGRHGHVDSGHVEVEKGQGSRSGHPPIDPFESPNLVIPSFSLGLTPSSQSLPGGSGTLQMPPPPGLGFAPFHSPHPISFGFSRFRAPPPPSTTGSSTPHQPISQASSYDEEERKEDTNVVQYLGFKHRVGKKTTRFTLSDSP
ncbi:hypothetical protein M9H77_28359 [Catharanthus roseus]|uniref:Uncharacterized protein n=1 Tax=Catharanthus roseus TaxID=4058 RepID=A0ACC0AJ94_CATRO|nr:hypothetical protein M9H77_28359 [Catharanthus roseus]